MAERWAEPAKIINSRGDPLERIYLGVRGFQCVVIGPQVGLSGSTGYLRETYRRRVVQELDGAYPKRRVVELGNRVDAGDPRQVFGSRLIKRAAGILQGCR